MYRSIMSMKTMINRLLIIKIGLNSIYNKEKMLHSHFAMNRLGPVRLFPFITTTKRYLENNPILVGEALYFQDIKIVDLNFISESLGQPYLCETVDEPKFPVPGLIYTVNGRRCVNLIMQRGEKKIYVPFIINSGSPANVIAEDTLRALGLTDFVPQQINVNLHGFKIITFNYCGNDSPLKNINLLGYQFFQMTKVCEFFNVENMELTLHKSVTEFLKTINNKRKNLSRNW